MSMDDFVNMHCVPCEGNEPPMSEEEISQSLSKVAGWNYDKEKKNISRRFQFTGFNKTMSFINAVAWIINQEGHHPTIRITYDHCDIIFTTHAIDGLSTNDFICAARINTLSA